MDNYLNRIQEVTDAYEAAKEILVEDLGKELANIFKQIVANSKRIHYFRFNQYAPHFNDGDPCEFESNHQYGGFFGFLENDVEYEDAEFGEDDAIIEYADFDTTDDDLACMKKFKAILKDIPLDFYLDAFGQSSEITFERNGSFYLDDNYEHD